MKPQPGIFNSCDIALEQHWDGDITVLANSTGRAALQAIMPEMPIDWEYPAVLPGDWCHLTLRLVGDLAHHRDINSLRLSLWREGSRVGIKRGEDCEIMEEN